MSKSEWFLNEIQSPTADDLLKIQELFPNTLKIHEQMERQLAEHQQMFDEIMSNMLNAKPLDPTFQKILDDNLLDLF